MFRQLFVFVFVILTGIHCKATTTLTIGDVEACPLQEVLVTVDAIDLLDVAAITMFIGYNLENAEFVTLENIHPSLAGGIVFNGMTFPSVQIGISWSSINPVNIPSGKLFDIRFIYFGGDCPLPFNPGYEFVRSDLSIITDVELNSGSLYPAIIITSQPQNINITEGSTADFIVNTNDGVGYHWMENSGTGWQFLDDVGIYSGALSNHLQLDNVLIGLNEFWYRCEITKNDCSLFSDSALLTVDSSSSITIEEQQHLPYGLTLSNSQSGIDLIFDLSASASVVISFFNTSGIIIAEKSINYLPSGVTSFRFDSSFLPAGMYFLKVSSILQSKKHQIIKKCTIVR